jgi:hypothetical protein
VVVHTVLWITVVYLLSAVGYPPDSWQFWCFLGTYWAMKEVGRTVGKVQGIIDFVELSEQDQRRLKQEIKALKGETK